MSFAAGDARSATPATGSESMPLVSRMRMLPGSLSVRRIFPVRQEREAPRRGQIVDQRRNLEGRRRVIGCAGLLGECGLVVALSPADGSRSADLPPSPAPLERSRH